MTSEQEHKLNHLIYQAADSMTDRNGDIDQIGSSQFEIGSKPIKDFFVAELQAGRTKSFSEGRIRELEILKTHMDRQINLGTVNTSSIYEYISSAIKHITPSHTGEN